MISHPPLRVVIADDEPDLRLLLRMQLDRHQDFEVVGEAADGSQAVEQVKRTGVGRDGRTVQLDDQFWAVLEHFA